ncbi:MAG: hypothetical protein AB1497_11475, partial [Bacillota bacterium]
KMIPVAQGGRVRPALRQASLDEVLRTVRASRWTSPEAAGLVPAEVHVSFWGDDTAWIEWMYW